MGPGVGSLAVLAPATIGITPVVVEQAASKRFGITAWLASGWLILVISTAVLAPWLPLADPNKIYPGLKRGAVLAGPGTTGHLLGSDASGHDLLSRTVFGSRASLILGVASVLFGLVLGAVLGLIAGYYRGRIDALLTILFDAMLAIPQIVLALALVAVFAPYDITNPVSDTRRLVVLIFSLGIVSVPILGRITRASTLSWSQREFVLAAKALGAKNPRIIIREILPNVAPAMFSIAILGIAVVITAEGGLSILGIGIQGTPSWGNIIASATSNLLAGSPWPVIVPSIAIFLTVLSLNYLGDIIRARSDVREAAI
jgi:peptide/nickel transport system permease protein